MVVGIVIVSHSPRVAESVKELIIKLVNDPNLKIEAVGGVPGDPNAFGTDPLKVREAILRVYDGDGVVVIGDIGSAIIGSKVAIKMLPPDVKEKVVIADAPLIEGAFLAAFEATTGSDLEQVKKAAEEAYKMNKLKR